MAGSTFIREWRKFRNLTQEQLAERIEMSVGTISRVETGQQPYSQPMLEAIAAAVRCAPADLLSRRPDDPQYELWTVIQGMKPEDRAQAIKVIKALAAA